MFIYFWLLCHVCLQTIALLWKSEWWNIANKLASSIWASLALHSFIGQHSQDGLLLVKGINLQIQSSWHKKICFVWFISPLLSKSIDCGFYWYELKLLDSCLTLRVNGLPIYLWHKFSAVPVRNVPVQNGLIAWLPVLLLSASKWEAVAQEVEQVIH